MAVVAGCLSLATLPLSVATLPVGRATLDKAEGAETKGEGGLWRSVAPMFDLMKQPAPRRMLVFKLTLGVGLSMQHSMQSVRCVASLPTFGRTLVLVLMYLPAPLPLPRARQMILRDDFQLTAQSMGVMQSIGGAVAVATK